MGETGEMRKMRGNGEQWGEMGGNGGRGGGGNGERAVIAYGMWVVEGCGGMWLRKWEGGKNGTKYAFFSPVSPIFPEVEDLPSPQFSL